MSASAAKCFATTNKAVGASSTTTASASRSEADITGWPGACSGRGWRSATCRWRSARPPRRGRCRSSPTPASSSWSQLRLVSSRSTTPAALRGVGRRASRGPAQLDLGVVRTETHGVADSAAAHDLHGRGRRAWSPRRRSSPRAGGGPPQPHLALERQHARFVLAKVRNQLDRAHHPKVHHTPPRQMPFHRSCRSHSNNLAVRMQRPSASRTRHPPPFLYSLRSRWLVSVAPPAEHHLATLRRSWLQPSVSTSTSRKVRIMNKHS